MLIESLTECLTESLTEYLTECLTVCLSEKSNPIAVNLHLQSTICFLSFEFKSTINLQLSIGISYGITEWPVIFSGASQPAYMYEFKVCLDE